MLKATIIDGYIDEPTCLGVPPYISPYPRYIAGSIITFDKKSQICYFTIDQIRKDESLVNIASSSDIVVIIAGVSVPGKYLSGYPASPNEIISLLKKVKNPVKILVGPAAKYGFGLFGGKSIKDIETYKDFFDLVIKGDAEITIFNLLKEKLKVENVNQLQLRKNGHSIRDFAILGSDIVTKHPFFPDYLIAEIETFRGCPRSYSGGCSFCSEPSKGLPDFRPIKDIVDEIDELYKKGIKNFRLGNQPCIFSYMAKNAETEEFPKPNPELLTKLFSKIREVAANLKTLHIDNANPGVIARFPDECKKIAKTIIKYHTPGDVAAFGIESVDPQVIKQNNLKADPEDSLKAIKILNEVGSKLGSNGMPELLPGLNFVFGLKGETKTTFDLNFQFLKNILDEKLLVRRINIRQVIPIPETKMYELGIKNVVKHKKDFKIFKRRVKEEIERPMLKEVVKKGTVLKDVYTECYEGKLTFARQLGSYPLLIGIPGVIHLNKFYNLKVIDYGFRSVTAIPYPLDINKSQRKTLEAIPGIGKKRVVKILANRPFKNKEELKQTIDDSDVLLSLLKYVEFK